MSLIFRSKFGLIKQLCQTDGNCLAYASAVDSKELVYSNEGYDDNANLFLNTNSLIPSVLGRAIPIFATVDSVKTKDSAKSFTVAPVLVESVRTNGVS